MRIFVGHSAPSFTDMLTQEDNLAKRQPPNKKCVKNTSLKTNTQYQMYINTFRKYGHVRSTYPVMKGPHSYQLSFDVLIKCIDNDLLL